MGRSPCCEKDSVKKGPWSPDEDATLKAYVETHGIAGSWIALPRKAGLKRCGKSCRLRWLNYLRPNIKHGDFTEEEDNLIFHLYDQYGSRWSAIASQLCGRTDNDVKNYWNTKLKKKKKKLFLAAGNTKLQTQSHAIAFASPNSLPLTTLTTDHQFTEIDNNLEIIPTVSSGSSFSEPAGDEWGLMEDWGCDFPPPDMVCSMLLKEKINGEFCL